MTNQVKNLIKKAIDLHVHIGPEIIPRKFTSVDQLIRSERGHIGGMALKNHFYSTQPFIAESKLKTNLQLIGGVVLNNFQGGLNPEAVYANSILAAKPTIVWLPTINAKQFLSESEFEIAPEWVGNSSFQTRQAKEISPVVIDQRIKAVLTVIKSQNAILATGHISWSETVDVIALAMEMGLKKLIVTHPVYQRIGFPLTEQIKLAKKGAKMEHCFSMYSIDKIPVKIIANQIKAVGAENCILSSDVGQTFSPSPSEALALFAKLLLQEGITIKQLEWMLVTNPNKLIEQ